MMTKDITVANTQCLESFGSVGHASIHLVCVCKPDLIYIYVGEFKTIYIIYFIYLFNSAPARF